MWFVGLHVLYLCFRVSEVWVSCFVGCFAGLVSGTVFGFCICVVVLCFRGALFDLDFCRVSFGMQVCIR